MSRSSPTADSPWSALCLRLTVLTLPAQVLGAVVGAVPTYALGAGTVAAPWGLAAVLEHRRPHPSGQTAELGRPAAAVRRRRIRGPLDDRRRDAPALAGGQGGRLTGDTHQLLADADEPGRAGRQSGTLPELGE